MSEEGTKKSRLFLERKPNHEDKFSFVTHLVEKDNAHLFHNPKTGKYEEKPCDCKAEGEE